MLSDIIWIVGNLFAAILYTTLGFNAILLEKEPVMFIRGESLDKDEITSVESYNFLNGLMWILYSVFFWTAAIIGPINRELGEFIVGSSILPGAFFLLIIYKIIYNNHKK